MSGCSLTNPTKEQANALKVMQALGQVKFSITITNNDKQK